MSYLPKDPAIFLPSNGATSGEDLAAARERIDDTNARRWATPGLIANAYPDPIASRVRETAEAVERIGAQMTIEEMREEYVELRTRGGLLFEIIVRGNVPKDSPPARWVFEARKLARERSKRR